MKFWIPRIKICRFTKIPLEGCDDDETVCQSEELNLHMSLLRKYPCALAKYPLDPIFSFVYLLRGCDYHRLRSICDSFDLDSVRCAFNGETKPTFASLRSSLEKQSHYVC